MAHGSTFADVFADVYVCAFTLTDQGPSLLCLQDKHLHPAPTMDAETDASSGVEALRDGVVTEGLAAQVHRMLKTDLTARRKWLGGMPLHLALLESSSPPRSGRSMLSGTPRTQTPPISEHQEWPGCGAAEMNIMCLEPT